MRPVSDFIDDGDDYMPPESSESDDNSIELSSDTNVDSDGDDLVLGIYYFFLAKNSHLKQSNIFFCKKTESQMIKLTRFSDTVFICLHKTKKLDGKIFKNKKIMSVFLQSVILVQKSTNHYGYRRPKIENSYGHLRVKGGQRFGFSRAVFIVTVVL